MRPPIFSPLVRLRYRYDPAPDAPDAIVGPRPRGSRLPHTDAKVARVRRLVEETTLTHLQIAARTGVSNASVSRWRRDGGWKRPPFAPRAPDTVPSWRASVHLRRRMLSVRLTALAERHIAELEAAACVDPDKLGEAIELVKMAKLAGMSRRRRQKAAGFSTPPPREPTRPMGELLVADVDLHRAPRAAIEDFLANRAPPLVEEKPRRRGRGYNRYKSDEYHAWMMEKK
jgi:hypothetical protein